MDLSILDSTAEKEYWSARYAEEQTGWDVGYPSDPIKNYIDQLKSRDLSILIPGAGNAHEAAYLWQNGFRNVFILDIAAAPLDNFGKRFPDFPKEQLIQQNFFEHGGSYDLILEQTFFCSFVPTPENRMAYAKKMADLLHAGGKLVGLWFNFPRSEDYEKRPFGGSREEYLTYFEPYFEVKTFIECTNSIAPRAGNELFGIFVKK